mmetsp:Transcript_20485/g.51886  ORF Transcript_20485/g.51886 Transcript_20485/m.51886 type:complete len:464 (-) Transcript_20485:77-1468(-)|eukprot:CAMPEP_0177647526 /NCGR_PEP_ID=MMETSP0447-20121125/10344_1 /TAXON_ID=0 /ORGANISM="Stygamoeba regulata, Strain BSH-02190019" /LENGTH=463 /DNA_ID=CAMNT_0019150111 /DNA_START=176 /DNA_END=1567 /DNA_ORIENTATION=-
MAPKTPQVMPPLPSEALQNKDNVPLQKAKREPCVFTINGAEYDVSAWVDQHPGGEAILRQYHGHDASEAFRAFHQGSEEAYRRLGNFPSRPLPADRSSSPQTDAPEIVGFQKLKARLEKDGLFRCNPLWVLYKTVTTVGLYALAVLALHLDHWVVSMVLLGMAWQQSGWLGHDYCHQQNFASQTHNNYFGYVMGNFLQGFSVIWWKERHNGHHAVTNILDADPDSDNLPLFCWTEKDLHNPRTKAARWLLRYQAWYFVPLFCPMLRIIWLLQSAFFVKDLHKHTNKFYLRFATIEKISLIGHYAWVFGLYLVYADRFPNVAAMFLHLFVAQCIAGFGIAITVFMNHYACPFEDKDAMTNLNFVRMQLQSSRNIAPGYLSDWYTGGLSYQIEHHLFPTMPRHNLYKCSKYVKEFCAEYSIPYQVEGWWGCLKEVEMQLAFVASKVTEFYPIWEAEDAARAKKAL